jgi:two-component system sensor histidine kinase KdpD
VFCRPTGLDEVVAAALDQLGPASRDVIVDIPESLPEVNVDPAILERVIVNLTGNALRYSPPGKPPLLAASALGDRVELRVVDRGPGIPADDRDRVFVPFQRLGDTDNTSGVGLGLALSRGLTEVMGGTLDPDETPGGGLTMIISLLAAPGGKAAAEPGQRERDATVDGAAVDGAGTGGAGTGGAGGPVARDGPSIATARGGPGAAATPAGTGDGTPAEGTP